jgi:hypothetical protein
LKKAGLLLSGILALLSFGCHPGERKGGNNSADGKPAEIRGNISFLFPSKGYAYDHRHELIQKCLDGIRHDLPIISLHEFTDTFTIRFLESRQEMKEFTGIPASGVTILEPQKIIYLLANEKEAGAPIDHELMHMITLAEWGNPDRSSLWMNEGLAAFSQNNCNGYTDEQIYRYFVASGMLLPMDSMANQFYQEPELIAYHQAGCIVEYLVRKYGVEKFRDLWQQGFYHFNQIYGTTFSLMEADIKATAERDYPRPPKIDWKAFSVGCY